MKRKIRIPGCSLMRSQLLSPRWFLFFLLGKHLVFKTIFKTLLGNIKTDKFSSWGINNLYWIWCLSLQIAQPPDSNYIATHQSTDIGKLLLQETETMDLYSCTSGDFEKLKEPEDQVAMESVRSDLILWDLFNMERLAAAYGDLCCRCPTSWRWSLWGNT